MQKSNGGRYIQQYNENVYFGTVTLNNNTVISNKENSPDRLAKSAISFDSSYYDDDLDKIGKVIFNGSNIEISVDGGEAAANGISCGYSTKLELFFGNNVTDSKNVNITVKGGYATGIGTEYDGQIAVNGSFGGSITAISQRTENTYDWGEYLNNATGINATLISMDGEFAGTVVAWNKNIKSDDYECYGSAAGIYGENINIGKISGTVIALNSCLHYGEEEHLCYN